MELVQQKQGTLSTVTCLEQSRLAVSCHLVLLPSSATTMPQGSQRPQKVLTPQAQKKTRQRLSQQFGKQEVENTMRYPFIITCLQI